MAIEWRRGFSTLGCLDLTAEETAALAHEHRIDGVELRVGLVELPAPDELRRTFEDRGVTVFAVASSARIADADRVAETAVELRRDVETAIAVGAAFVRVFPGGVCRRTAAAHLAALSDLIDGPTGSDRGGPVIAVETHDALPTGREVAQLVVELDHPRLGAVWDALHPWRHGEAPAQTADALLGLPGYVQVKDARSAQDTTPRLLGTGAVPLAEIRRELRSRAYDGWVSIEWERAWYPAVPPLAAVLEAPAGW